jgi:NTE family protein
MGQRVSWALVACLLAACTPEQVAPDRLPSFDSARVGRPNIALVLGGGGPRGFAHVGVIKVLEEAGIVPDLIVGASVGAMVGAVYAAGTRAAQLEREALDLNLIRFFELSMVGGGRASGGYTQAWVNEHVGGRPIEKLDIPLVVTAKRQRDGEIALFNRGDTGLAVRASSASPDTFAPVAIGAETYVDGDEASPVPIRVARSLGARLVIAVDVSAYPETTPADVPREWVEKDARRARIVAQEAPGANVLLHPDIGYYAGHSADYRKRVIAAAEAYTRRRLPDILAAVGKPASAGAQPISTGRMPPGVASR